jgi:hypothetical protein
VLGRGIRFAQLAWQSRADANDPRGVCKTSGVVRWDWPRLADTRLRRMVAGLVCLCQSAEAFVLSQQRDTWEPAP